MYPKGSESYSGMQNRRKTVSKAVGVGSNPTARVSQRRIKMITYDLYTDGGCRNNGKQDSLGAWAFVLLHDNKIISQHSNVNFHCSTNIRAEMLAVIYGLQIVLLNTNYHAVDQVNVNIYTDSKFICDTINMHWLESWQKNKWRKKDKTPVANQDLWQIIIIFKQLLNNITFNYVKGHNGNIFNEKCDKLVNIAMDMYKNYKK